MTAGSSHIPPRKNWLLRYFDYIHDPAFRRMRLEDFIIDQFVEQAIADKDEKYFNSSLFKEMSEESKRLKGIYWKLSTINTVLVAILFAGIFSLNVSFDVVGMHLAQATSLREIILFLSSNLGAVAVFINLHARILRKSARVLKERTTPAVADLSNFLWYDTSDFTMIVVKSAIFNLALYAAKTNNRKISRYVKIMSGLLFYSAIHIFVIAGVIFAAHLAIMINVWNHPSFWWPLSHAVVVYVAVIDLLIFLVSLFVTAVPLRYRADVFRRS